MTKRIYIISYKGYRLFLVGTKYFSIFWFHLRGCSTPTMRIIYLKNLKFLRRFRKYINKWAALYHFIVIFVQVYFVLYSSLKTLFIFCWLGYTAFNFQKAFQNLTCKSSVSYICIINLRLSKFEQSFNGFAGGMY